MDLTTAARGSLEYVYGGGFCAVGGDANVFTGKVAATNCSTGLINSALYNGYFTGIFQFCLIATSVGNDVGSAALGGSLNGYFEGNGYDLLWNAAYFSHNAYYEIASQHGFDPNKIAQFDVRYSNNALARKALSGLSIRAPSTTWAFERERTVEGGWNEAVIGFDRGSSSSITMHGDSTVLLLRPGDPVFQRLFGYRARIVYLTGTGPDNRPTGSLTVRPTNAAMRINGGAAGAEAVFSGFTKPVVVQVAIDPDLADNYLVSFMGGK